jgi:hypothetical protein
MKGFPNGISDSDSTKCLINGDFHPAGTILPGGGFTFSTRYLKCPWTAYFGYGPEEEKVAAEWEEVRTTPTEPGWGVYFKEDISALRAAIAQCGGPENPVPGEGTQDVVNCCLWLIGQADGTGEWPSEAQAERYVDRWKGEMYAESLLVAQKLRDLLPPLYRRQNAYGARKNFAKAKDEAYAKQFPSNDGPPLRVIRCERAAGYDEDPQCFGGAYWLHVVPATEVTSVK